MVVVRILCKARKIWAHLEKILVQEVTSLRVLGGFQGGSAGGSFIQVGDVSADLPQGTVPGKLLAKGRQADNRKPDKETGGGGLGVPTAGDSNGGGEF